jgi:hypothetical protein
MSQTEQLIFSESPRIEISTNVFENVPTILQVHDTPLIEVIKEHAAGYTTQISIYHNDGTYLAKVKGSQLYATEDGKKAGIQVRHPGLLTVCELGGQTLFELRRDHAAALKLSAELHSPTGIFIKAHSNYKTNDVFGEEAVGFIFPPGAVLGVKDLTVSGQGDDAIGLHCQNDGWLVIGKNCLVKQDWKGEPVGLHPPHTVWLRMATPEGSNGVANVRLRYDQTSGSTAKARPSVVR